MLAHPPLPDAYPLTPRDASASWPFGARRGSGLWRFPQHALVPTIIESRHMDRDAPIPPLFKGEGGRLAKPSGRVGCVAGEGPHPSRRFRGEPPSPAARGRDKRRPFYALRSSLGADPSPLQRGGWPIGEAKRTGGVRCRKRPPPVSLLAQRATLPASRRRDKRRRFYALRSSLGADPSPLQRG